MATVDLTEPIFAETIENNTLVILDFWAEWCGPCKAYGPVYERVSEEFPDVVFGKIDTEGMNDGSVLGSRLGNEDGSNDGSLDGTCDGATKM